MSTETRCKRCGAKHYGNHKRGKCPRCRAETSNYVDAEPAPPVVLPAETRLGSVDEALAAIKSDCGWAHDVLSDELTALRAVREAAERYMEHGRHAFTCDGYSEGGCDCGFAALRAALARPASGETEPAASSDPNPEGNRRE